MLAVVRLALLAFGLLACPALGQEGRDWTGVWDTFWRDGEARMTLQRDGDRVTGSYVPGAGSVEGTLDGRVMTGIWRQDGLEGPIVFSLAEDGQSFTGRYVDGEYWNGSRVAPQEMSQPTTPAATPREALERFVALQNAADYGSNLSAVGALDGLMLYAGEPLGDRDQRHRRNLLWTLIDLSTFRLYDAPGEVAEDSAEFRLGPSAATADFTLNFQRRDGAWHLVAPSEAALRATLDRFLSTLGYPTLAALNAARENSPRQTMRDFLQGIRAWNSGGEAQTLRTLDLSGVPPRLYTVEAPLLAEYLKQVIDRAGYVTWQEIPDDPERTLPYVFYRHPAGSIVIDRVAGAEGAPDRWLFTAETLRDAPALFAAMQDLPTADGIPPSAPVTRFFEIREWFRALSPRLLHRIGPLDLWQWIALPLSVAVALVLGWIAGHGVTLLAFTTLRHAERGVRVDATRLLGRPTGTLVASGAAVWLFTKAGLAQTLLGTLTVVLAAIATVAVGWLCYVGVEVLGGYFQRRAQRTRGFVDEIATSLTLGILKVIIVALTLIAMADVTGLPYEGVIAGLGVGGVALAFAARETVTNLIGGAILMSDRPFRRGDLVETGDTRARVEQVGLRSTRLRTFDDCTLIIPNSQLTDKSIINWGQRRKRKVQLVISLTYDTPRERLDVFVTRLRALYLAQPGADATTGFVGLKALGASSLDVELWGYFFVADYPAHVAAQHRLIGDIVELAQSLDIHFAFPTQTIHVVPDEGQAEGVKNNR
ncbi:mechanosensitive ion channel family protein [Pararhodobacter zhoushanensis]|uniref:mechanosensitive ion channel family protein n=1 Tax=Pararhodobacter zhoushanensis TaxID=2479545 RepID=UPI000F8E11C8|nr:mechanosensitive ion channel family protein [Pararhodobacter zhoushanensis]